MLAEGWMRKATLSAGLLALLPLSTSGAQLSDTSYFPLRLGNQWTYQATLPGGKTTTITETIVDTARVAGDLYFAFDPRNVEPPVYLRSSGGKVYGIHPPDTASALCYDFGADSGATWTFPGKGKMTVRGVNETVAVPAGDYAGCRLIESFVGIDAMSREWFARGIGVVKREVITIAGAMVWELVTVLTTVSDLRRENPSFSLEQNFPNPFNPATRIRFYVRQSSHVDLRVYNILGQTLETLLDGEVGAGSHDMIWKPRNLPSGVYFCRMEVAGSVQMKKLVLIR